MAAFIESLQTESINVARITIAHNAAVAAASKLGENANADSYTKAYVKAFQEILTVVNG